MIEKFEKLFAPREDLLLDEEDRGAITDLLTKHPEIWRVEKKYIYNKINFLTRKLAKCKPEELQSLQDRIELCKEYVSDHEMIKKDYLRKSTKSNTVSRVKDLFYYITSQDIRDKNGKVKVSPHAEDSD